VSICRSYKILDYWRHDIYTPAKVYFRQSIWT